MHRNPKKQGIFISIRHEDWVYCRKYHSELNISFTFSNSVELRLVRVYINNGNATFSRDHIPSTGREFDEYECAMFRYMQAYLISQLNVFVNEIGAVDWELSDEEYIQTRDELMKRYRIKNV